MALSFHLVDAFTDHPFAGNPAGVVLLREPLPDAVLQSVAMEMNQAETAFLLPEGDDWRLRWFTPEVEVDLCGHATLAAAATLWADGHLHRNEEATFLTRSGPLVCRRSSCARATTPLARNGGRCSPPQYKSTAWAPVPIPGSW